MTAMKTIIRIATKNKDEPYNILMLLADDIEYILELAKTGNNIYIWSTVNGTTWPEGLQKPENCYTVTGEDWPVRLDLDLAICSNRGFFQFFEGDKNVFSSEDSREAWGKLGYVVPKNDDSFCEAWNNILQESCSLIYTRM